MSGRPTPRLHRLPVRTDYVLVPAPLDLSLPLVSEKSTLPAIIVTPSSPSSARDFSIAFIQPPPKQSLRDRLSSFTHYNPLSPRLRSVILILLLVFVLLCHLVTHQLAAAYRPRMDMQSPTPPAHGMRFKNVQSSFSWSRIVGGHRVPVEDAPLRAVTVVGSTHVAANANADAEDILGLAVDADVDATARRLEAL
ncbi:hypothetical protein CVT24_003725 [Panaeolus cyanescens]|uniref:Uncharacterized protein n=1 Tax=Panaeolus cyanescens TaxID=181874 RepID=A0A409W8F0_9AGAR|nr:hypothetical protein CVT24_003725 [Panaeolus cyanescens]